MTTMRQFKSDSSNSSSQSSWSATFDATPLQGSLLIAVVGYIGFSGSIKDLSVTGFELTRPNTTGSVGLGGAAKLAGESESTTVTASLSGSTTDSSAIVIAEFTGSFSASSLTDAISAMDYYSSSAVIESLTCPPLDVTGPHLVIPMLGVSGSAQSATINLDHSFIAHPISGTSSWMRGCAAAYDEIADDATHAPTWSWTGETGAACAAQMAFPLSVTQLATPTGFTFTASGLQLDGAWSAVSGADSYDWEIQRDDAGSWVAFESGNTATLAFQVTTGVAYGTTYRARVRADDGGVKSDWTAYTSASTPADAFAISGQQIEAVALSWMANTGPYDIRRDETTLIAEGLTVTTFTDDDVTGGTSYTYEVREDGGAWSAPVTVAVVAGGGGVFFLKPNGGGWST